MASSIGEQNFEVTHVNAEFDDVSAFYPSQIIGKFIHQAILKLGPSVAGLPDSFWRDWTANHALFPCGVDIVFAADSQLLALPRSIAVEA